MSSNLYDSIFKKQASVSKDSPFLKLPNGSIFTYRDAINESGKYANALKEFGLRKNSRLVVQTEKYSESIWLYLGCLRVGATYVPLNTAYTIKELNFFVQDCKPTIFVSDNLTNNFELKLMLKRNNVAVVMSLNETLEKNIKDISSTKKCEFETCSRSKNDIAAILYTSGTTGRSKGAMISHENLASNAEDLVNIWRIKQNDTLLHILPIYHTHGLFVAINTIIFAGASLIFLPNFQVDLIIKNLKGSSVMMGVPTHYRRLLEEKNFGKESTKNMRLFISGSAPLSIELHKKFKAVTGFSILERYGMTETNMLTSNPYEGTRKAGTVGLPLPRVKLRIVNKETRELLGQQETGSIEVAGPNVFKQYWRQPQKSKQDFTHDGFFITGDLGFLDSQGYLNISGREKDLIISGGLNVYPAEVEKVIDALPGVLESAVIGLPHFDYGEGVTAIVTTSNETRFDHEKIRSLLKKELASFKVPQKIIEVNYLPKNTMGKIQKNKLRDQYKSLYD